MSWNMASLDVPLKVLQRTSDAARLVTFANPAGDLSINDLELAGHVAHLWLALPLMSPLTTILSGSDNSTSIYWIRKGSTSTSKTAGALLRLRSWLLRQHQVAAPVTFLAGKDNHLAGAASRRWDLTDSQLCSLFDRDFPQATSWTMLHLTSQQRHELSTAFARTRLPLASIRAAHPPIVPTGGNGAPSAATYGPPSWKGGLRHHPAYRPVAVRPDTSLPARLRTPIMQCHASIMTQNSAFRQFPTPTINLVD
jgi:hypothetical protein